MLEAALETEQDAFLISRYTFYLAQSYRDCGENAKALDAYLRRAGQGFWDEEVFFSLYRAAQLKEALGYPDHDIIGTYLKAYETCPTRAESLHGAMRYCRLNDKFHQAYLIGGHALTLARPEGGLFVEDWIYDYGLLDEYSISAYWAGHYEQSLMAGRKILDEAKIPREDLAEAIRDNARFAVDKIIDWTAET